jgi:hypothetical protein
MSKKDRIAIVISIPLLVFFVLGIISLRLKKVREEESKEGIN